MKMEKIKDIKKGGVIHKNKDGFTYYIDHYHVCKIYDRNFSIFRLVFIKVSDDQLPFLNEVIEILKKEENYYITDQKIKDFLNNNTVKYKTYQCKIYNPFDTIRKKWDYVMLMYFNEYKEFFKDN